MKKFGLALVLVVGLAGVLTGCGGDMEHDNVLITGKEIVAAKYLKYMIYFDDNGKEYVYPTAVREYNEAVVGERVDATYSNFQDSVYIEPSKK